MITAHLIARSQCMKIIDHVSKDQLFVGDNDTLLLVLKPSPTRNCHFTTTDTVTFEEDDGT